MQVCASCMCIVPTWRREESIRSPCTEVTDGCNPLYRGWELNLGPLKEQKNAFNHWAISLDHKPPQIPYSLKFFTESEARHAPCFLSCFCILGLCHQPCFLTWVLWDWIYSSCLCDKYLWTEPFPKTHLPVCVYSVCWHNYIQDIEVLSVKNLPPQNLDVNNNDETYTVT